VSIKTYELQRLSDQLTQVNIEKNRSEQEYKSMQQQIDADQDPPKVAEMVALDPEVQQARSAVENFQTQLSRWSSAMPRTARWLLTGGTGC